MSPCDHQPAPALRENLPSNPTYSDMEIRVAGAAQGVLKMVAMPSVASSRFPEITLDAFLEKDRGHPG